MTQPDGPDIRKPFPNGPAIDCHRVHILQHHRVRAELFHVGTQIPQEGHGTKPAHDSADAQRVGDCLAKTVFLRYLEIGNGTGLVATDLHRDDDKIGSVQRLAPRGGGADGGADLQCFDNAFGDKFGFGEPLLINIHQRDFSIAERRHQQCVAKKVPQEDGGACSDKGNFRHI